MNQVLHVAKTPDEITLQEADPVRAEIIFVSHYIYAWLLPKHIDVGPRAYAAFRAFVRRFPHIMKSEYAKAREIKKLTLANDIFTLEGRTKVISEAGDLWPVNPSVYLSGIAAA